MEVLYADFAKIVNLAPWAWNCIFGVFIRNSVLLLLSRSSIEGPKVDFSKSPLISGTYLGAWNFRGPWVFGNYSWPQKCYESSFRAHSSNTRGPPNMQSQDQLIKLSLFAKSTFRPWILDLSEFSLSKLSFWYFKYPKDAISDSRAYVYIFWENRRNPSMVDFAEFPYS